MALAAEDGVVLQDWSDARTTLLWMFAIAAAVIVVVIAMYVMENMGWDGAVSVTIFLLILGLASVSMFLSGGIDAAKINEGTLNSSYGISDVRLGGGGGISGLMAHPKDGTWRVTYKDSKGGRRTGRMEIADSQSGSPTIRMKDDSGAAIHPRS